MKKNTTILIVSLVSIVVIIALVAIIFPYLSKQYENKNIDNESKQVQNVASEEKNEDADSEEPKQAAPALLVQNKDDEYFNLADAKGKIVILNFWASWCPPCRAEFPDFQKFYEANKDNDKLEMVLVNLTGARGENRASADKFIKDGHYTLPYYYDDTQEAANSYAIQSIPTTYIIDPDGNLYARVVGMVSEDSLSKVVEELQTKYFSN